MVANCGTGKVGRLAIPKWLPASLVAISLLVGGCSNSFSAEQKSTAVSAKLTAHPNEPISKDGVRELYSLIAAGTLPELNYPDFLAYRTELEEFYEASGGTLPWLDDGKPTAQARAVIQLLKTAEHEGLSPQDYDGSRWEGRVARLDEAEWTSDLELVRFDLGLTVSVMRYVSDLHLGRVNPHLFHFEFDVQHEPIDLSEFVRQELVHSNDVNTAMAQVDPPFPAYRRAQWALDQYLDLARRDDGEPLPVPRKPVKPGDSYAGMPRLRRLLTLVGDLREPETMSTGLIYQGAIVQAVKHFQRRHGLEPSGQLDVQTVRQLNTPLSKRVTQLELSLERWRWLPHEFDRPPIVVNIPEFRLHANDENYQWSFSMKVVVGKAYRRQTPVFSSSIRSVIFRPYWRVPISIQRSELLPKIKKDPGYLARNSYEIVDNNGSLVAESLTSLTPAMEQELRSGRLRIRQRPGTENALGLIKFDMPNPFDVYMHGTPAMTLFSKSRRDFSHGCIRVEDPVKLAEWVLKNNEPEWTKDRIEEAMNGADATRVRLDKPIPVLILYSTALVMEDGEVRFFDDIYGHDAPLESILEKGPPYTRDGGEPADQLD